MKAFAKSTIKLENTKTKIVKEDNLPVMHILAQYFQKWKITYFLKNWLTFSLTTLIKRN